MTLYERFGLVRAAFAPDAGPEFYVESEAHRRALAHLRHGLKQGEGIIILTGDDGIGKTTLLRRVQRETEGDHRQVLFLDARQIDEGRLPDAVMDLLTGPETRLDDSADLTDLLCDHRDRGRSYALYIDNAEALPDDELEIVRQLSTRYHDGEALLQISLAGETKLRSVLYRANMDKLRQRIIASYHIAPMSEAQSMEYVRARLKEAGAARDDIFSTTALERLAHEAGGVPARLNRLADAALHAADARGADHVGEQDVASPTAPLAEERPQTVPAMSQIETPPTPKPVAPPAPVVQKPVSTVTNLNGHHGAADTAMAKAKDAVSPEEINDAISRLSAPGPSVQELPPTAVQVTPVAPAAPARRGLSPQELMMGKRSPLAMPADTETSSPVDVAPTRSTVAVEEVKPTPALALPPAPPVDQELWAPAHAMGDDGADTLDRMDFGSVSGPKDKTHYVDQFLQETREKLDRLRATLKTLREETDKLDQRRRAVREKISEQIDVAHSRLDRLRGEG